jgi:hypothetical protein
VFKKVAMIVGRAILLLLGFGFTLSSLAAESCDESCLLDTMARFSAQLVSGTPIHLAPNAEARENMLLTSVSSSAWSNVRTVRSSMAFADATTGNVLSRNGVELKDGTAAYLSIRLNVQQGEISEVEFTSDVAQANAGYVWNLPAHFSAVLPPDLRTSREAMGALVRRYFLTLTHHVGVKGDFDDARCNRYHSGVQITNVDASDEEGQGVRTCFTSVDGPKPWGPAIEQRFRSRTRHRHRILQVVV